MGLLTVLCISQVHAQAADGADEGLSGLKLGTERPDVRAMLRKLSVAVGAVLVLGAMAVYAVRVWVPRWGPVSRTRVKVVEIHHLGGRKQLHLIEVGHRQLLVGSTPTQISMLADVTQHWDEGCDGSVDQQYCLNWTYTYECR